MDLAKVSIQVDADLTNVRREFDDAEDYAARSGRDTARAYERGLDRAAVNLGNGTGSGGFFSRGKLAFAGLAGGAIAATAVVGGLASVTGNFLSTAYEASLDGKRAEARFKTIQKQMGFTGKAFKGASDRAAEYALSMALVTGVDDAVIMSAQSMLATFSNVGKSMNQKGGMFDRATWAAIDLAAAGFGNAEGNAVALGKALNDPAKGLTALSRNGITFTAAEKEKIKALQESGDLLAAQNILMKAVETQVSGVAKATASGADKMSIAWGDFMGTVGDDIAPMFDTLYSTIRENVIPAIGDLWTELSPKVQTWVENFGDWLKTDGIDSIEGFFQWASTDGVLWASNFASAIGNVASFIGEMVGNIDLANSAIAQTPEVAAQNASGEKTWFNSFTDQIALGASYTPGTAKSLWDGFVTGSGNFYSGITSGDFEKAGKAWVDVVTAQNTQRYFEAAGANEYQKQVAASQKASNTASQARWDGQAAYWAEQNKKKKVPAMALGGYVTEPTMALIGERGPEYVIPERKLAAMSGSNVTVNVSVAGDGDAAGIKKAVREALDETMRRGTMRLVANGGY